MGSGGGVGREARDLRRGKVGSNCGLGPGVCGRAGRGLLIRPRPAGRLVLELEPRGGGGRESGRAGGVLEEAHGAGRETIWLSSRMYHDASSSSSPSAASAPGSGDKGASVNSKVSTGLASGFKREGVERETTSGWNDTSGEAMVLREGWR